MSMWRCPHCGTPQTEAARCWVCRRSSTACGTCRHFRRSVAAQLGYCGLDRQRLPLRGDEIRPCWEARAGAVYEEPVIAVEPVHRLRSVAPMTPDDRTNVRRLEFVPVGEPPDPAPRPRAAKAAATELGPASTPVSAAPPANPEPRWSLWGDLES
jgi:hypothetical protein